MCVIYIKEIFTFLPFNSQKFNYLYYIHVHVHIYLYQLHMYKIKHMYTCMYNVHVCMLHMVVMFTVCAGIVPDTALFPARVFQSWTSCSQEVCEIVLL